MPRCIGQLYIKHAGIFKNTREVCREARGIAKCSCTSWVFLKIPKCLYNPTKHKDKFFINIFFNKMLKKLHAP